jgi:hypothetical protein
MGRVGPSVSLLLKSSLKATGSRRVLPNIHHIFHSIKLVLLNVRISSQSTRYSTASCPPTYRLLVSCPIALSTQDALFLLKKKLSVSARQASVHIVQVTYHLSIFLSEYDSVIERTLKIVPNFDLTEAEWSQVTLLVSSRVSSESDRQLTQLCLHSCRPSTAPQS